MKLPREIKGEELVKRLARLGYKQSRQTGSHTRLTCVSDNGEHHITIPQHKNLRIGTLNGILAEVASYLNKKKSNLIDDLFADQL